MLTLDDDRAGHGTALLHRDDAQAAELRHHHAGTVHRRDLLEQLRIFPDLRQPCRAELADQRLGGHRCATLQVVT